MATNQVASNHKCVSYPVLCPGEQASETTQGSRGCAPSISSREGPSLLFQLWGLQVSLGWWLPPSLPFSATFFALFAPLTVATDFESRLHQDNQAEGRAPIPAAWKAELGADTSPDP